MDNLILRDLCKEVDFLRYFYSRAKDCMGPASTDCYDLIKEGFEDTYGSLPIGYGKSYKDENG